MNPPSANQPPAAAPTNTGAGLAIASFVLGLVALLLSLVVVGILFAVVGVVLGILHIQRRSGRNAMAWWGMALSVLAALLSIGLGVIYLRLAREARKAIVSMIQDTNASGSQAQYVPASSLKASSQPHTLIPVWSNTVSGATAICSGDWDGDGSLELLVADARHLHIFGADGVEKSSISLPDRFTAIECGRHAQKGPRLLGYSTWGHKVIVLDKAGKQLWSYTAVMGVDGARWGDLDGDGTDELIVGMNGFGGLTALSADGKELWKVALPNVWGQAVIPAKIGSPALVFATEASGSIRAFDGKGAAIRTLRPNGKYCTQIAAARIDASNTVQVVAFAQDSAITLDANGQIAWTEPMQGKPGQSGSSFAYGDIDADGVVEWAFVDAAGNLVLATPTGEKLASVPGVSTLTGFAILPSRGLIVILQSGKLVAYHFE